jgi:hypothetical protein
MRVEKKLPNLKVLPENYANFSNHSSLKYLFIMASERKNEAFGVTHMEKTQSKKKKLSVLMNPAQRER